MIDRLLMRTKLCHTLQTEYVALLGQRGTGVRTLVNALVLEKPPFAGMKFISIGLPRGIYNGDELKELFLKRLTEAAVRVPPETALASDVRKVLDDYEQYSVDFRLRIALETLGRGTIANYLVIVLHAFTELPEEPLRSLLSLLREYHDQRNNPGEAGARLRFLIGGDARLWLLCCYRTAERSPFNIAERVFLSGLSHEEIQTLDESRNLEAALKLRDLTDGVPSLIEKAINWPAESDDLSPFFGLLQDNWYSLSEASREALKRLAEGTESFPQCIPDFSCPQIPEVDSPWMEAFWCGFLRMRHRELAWRSPIHRAFLMERTNVRGDSSKSALVKVDLLDRTKRLGKVLREAQSGTNLGERIEEAMSLAVQTDGAELAPVLEMARRGERENIILETVEQIATNSDRGWIKELKEEITQKKESIVSFLINTAILGARRSLSDFDVFLCHNSKDKPVVKEIGKQLKERGILPWLDEWELRPGLPWQRLLEQQIAQIKSAAVFVGSEGIGPWQREELEAFLRQFIRRGCPVIPVLLPNAPGELDLPIFLEGRTWVDFRKDDPAPMEQLIWGITGERGARRVQ